VLANQGVDVIGVRRHSAGFRTAMLQAPAAVQNLPIVASPAGTAEDLYVCSETVPLNHLLTARRLGMRIAWWQLAPFGLLGKAHDPQLGEYLLPFSSYVNPDASHYFYYQPRLDQAWAAALEAPRRRPANQPLKVAFYPGKGRLRRLPDQLLALTRASEILTITRDQPHTREDLFGLLSQSVGLISFDELSQLNLEAASLQIPVFLANRLFPDRSLDNFVVKRLADWLTSDPVAFMDMIQGGRGNLAHSWTFADLMIANADTLASFRGLVYGQTLDGLICNQSQIDGLRIFSDTLRRSRLICANQKIGLSGGALLGLGDYIQYLTSSGQRFERIFLKIRFFDLLFMVLARLPFLTIGFWAFVKRLYLRLSNPSS